MQIQANSRCPGTNANAFVPEQLTSVLRREERDTILKSLSYHTMLTTPPMFGKSRGILDLNSSSLVGTRKTAAATVENSTLWQRMEFSAPMAETQLSACIVQYQSSTAWSDPNFSTPWSDPNFSTPWSYVNWIFFKIFQILSPSLPGMTSSTFRATFAVWSLLWQ